MDHASSKNSFFPPVSYEKANARADALLMAMTLDEKIDLVGGHHLFFTKGFEEYGIPSFYFADATQGVHIRRECSAMEKSTAFPCPLALAATWNTALSEAYARAVGEECRAGGIAVLLGPGVNIYRISQCGRNFEYFGEDPFLTARMVERYVVGVQNTGTIATLKHFLCNNTDHRRRRSNSIVDERAVHEIYLPAFEAGIAAGAMAVMTSYNLFNGEWTAQSKAVITGLLREHLGFKWLVMSDWWSIYNPLKAIQAGLDLDMPGGPFELFPGVFDFGDVYVKSNAKRLLADGSITESDIERMAKSILRTFISAGLLDRPVTDEAMTAQFPAHEQTALQTARESIVLLKNEQELLPISPAMAPRLLLTGWYLEKVPRGKGAAEVEGYNEVTLSEALSDKYGDNVVSVESPTDEQFAQSDAVVISVGTIDSEGFDKPFDLPAEMNALILRAAENNPNTIVIVYSGGGINMSPWNHKVRAVLYPWYPGQNGNRAVAEILAGEICPSAKLPITIEKDFADSPGYGYLPPDESLDTDFSADLCIDFPIRDIEYKEGIFVGYRWYEKMNITPLYPFGHGLSYTTFAYSDLNLTTQDGPAGPSVCVQCTITNTGPCDGMEIVQLYIHHPEAPVPRPVKELKGFQKIRLEPGRSKAVSFVLMSRDFAFWDEGTHCWKTVKGNYDVLIGSSSAAIHLRKTVTVE